MGYRSTVALALRDDLAKRLIQEMDLKTIAEFFGACARREKTADDSKWHLFYWDSVKWYPEFRDVKAVESFIGSLDGADCTDGYEFHCMGEEPDDYRVDNGGMSPFSIYLSRNLVVEDI